MATLPHPAPQPQVRNCKRQPIADTWLGAAFLTLLPGPLYYLPAFIVPLTLLASAYGAAHAADLLRFAADLPVVQVGAVCAHAC